LREVVKAKTSWLEAARAERKPIPELRYRPLIALGVGPSTPEDTLERDHD